MPPLLDKATPESRLILRSVICVYLGLILLFFFIFAGADIGPYAAARAGANAHAQTAADPFTDAASVVGNLFLRAS